MRSGQVAAGGRIALAAAITGKPAAGEIETRSDGHRDEAETTEKERHGGKCGDITGESEHGFISRFVLYILYVRFLFSCQTANIAWLKPSEFFRRIAAVVQFKCLGGL